MTIVVVVIRTTVTIITKISLFECSVRARKFKKKKKGCCFLELLIWQAEQPNQRKRCCTWMVLAAWYPHCCSPLLHNILCCLPSSCISAWKSSRSPVPALSLSYTAVDTCPYFSVSAPLPVKGAIKLAFAQLYGIFRHWSKGRLYFSTADRLLVVSSFFLLFPSSYLSVTQHPTVLKVHMLEGKKKKSVFSTECQHRSEATVTSLAWADYKWTWKVQVIHIHHLKMYQTKSQVWMKRSERKFNLLKQSKLLAIVRFECLFLIKNHFTWLSYFCRTAGILFF